MGEIDSEGNVKIGFLGTEFNSINTFALHECHG
jgi:hypothetical protein